MSGPINITNEMADSSSRNMFFIAFQEAAEKKFVVAPPQVDGEIRFYCQAGYVSSFRLSYTLNGQAVTKTTKDLSVGFEETFPIPYNATNIKAQGWYALAGWKDLFNVTLAEPTYICYTSYGTVFQPSYKTDCPEVGNMTTRANQLTVTQGGGYSAWVRLTYTQNGQTVTKLDQSSTAAGWRQVFDIPSNATNIRLQAWSNTGWIGEPWKTIIDKTWPNPPNECIKVYGTTLDPKWNNECN
jgi:Thiol-activated cytolysin beta sandwich domain